MKPQRTVEEWWQSLATRLFTPQHPDVQKREMRRAFYAGFFACLCANRTIAAEIDDEDTAVIELQKLEDQVKAILTEGK